MNTISIGARRKANLDTAKPCGRSRNHLRSNYAVMQRARSLFSSKTAWRLSEITGAPVRTVEYWLQKDRLPTEAVAMLLRSQFGMEFLAVLMADARPKWWISVQKAFRLGEMRRQKQQLDEAIREAEQFEATLTQSEAALRVLDEDFVSPHLNALRTMARVPNSAMARASKGKRK